MSQMNAVCPGCGVEMKPADRLEQRLRSLGPVGEQMIFEALGGRR